MKALLIVLAALISIAAWKKDMPANPGATSAWNILYSPGPTFRIQYPPQLGGQDGTSFDFPPKGPSVGYVVKTAPKLSLGQTISIKFTIEGYGTLVPTDSDPPARVRLYLQRAGDNGSGAGPYQHYRYWGHPDVVLGAARDYEVSVELKPENWSDVFGASGNEHPQAFADAVANAGVIGFTFGGMFAGHGIYVKQGTGSVRFVLKEYSIK